MIKIKHHYPLIILSLVFLCNPNMNILDILPDCIAYTLLTLVIGGLAQTVPYLAECKGALIKLALLTAIKIPAFTVMYSNLKYGSDIVPLFTLSFAVLELILICIAVKNLFLALSYIGERTDCISVRGPFSIGRRKSLSLEMIERVTVIFFVVKAVLNVLPELMLLYNEDFAYRKELMDSYPAVLVISVLAGLIIGIFWLKYPTKLAKHIHKSGDLPDAIKEIASYSHPEVSSNDKLVKRLCGALTLMAISSIFIFDISFQDYGGYNILPHFIYGVILYFAFSNLADSATHKTLLAMFTIAFSVASLINQGLTSRFFSMYEYVDLSYSEIAKQEYISIKICTVFEAAFVIALLVTAALILVSFIKDHTEVSPSDPTYTLTNKREHGRLIKTTLPLMVLAGIINILKCVNVFLHEKITVIDTATNPEGIAAGGAPALSTIIFLLSLSFVVYSFVVASNLKDAVKFKYNN